jgi:hypothetical protein
MVLIYTKPPYRQLRTFFQCKCDNKIEYPYLAKLIFINMDIISTIFTATGAVIIGIVLGFIIAGIIGVIVYGIIKIRDRNKKK